MGGERDISLDGDWGVDGKPMLDDDGYPVDEGPSLPVKRPEDQPTEGNLPADYYDNGYDDGGYDVVDALVAANPELGGERVAAALQKNMDQLIENAEDWPGIESAFDQASPKFQQFLLQHWGVIDPAPGRHMALAKLAEREGVWDELVAFSDKLTEADLALFRNRGGGRGWRR